MCNRNETNSPHFFVMERSIPGADTIAFHVMRRCDYAEMGRFLMQDDAIEKMVECERNALTYKPIAKSEVER